MNVNWWQAYEARFGKKLSEVEIDVWEEEISREIRNLQPGEVINAVRSIGENRRKQGQKGKAYAPTVEDIVSEIIKGKYARSNPGTVSHGHKVIVMHDGQIVVEVETERSWKQRLHAAGPVEAWNIICEPCDPAMCYERQAYADGHGVAYQRYTVNVAAQVRRAMQGVRAVE
jgi:hypothetical protein